MCQANVEWVDALPIVLIKLRICYKEDIRASTAELLYSKILRILEEFFDHEDMPNDPQPFVEPFQRFMQRMKATPVAHHVRNRPFLKIYTLVRTFSCETIQTNAY